MPSVARRRAFRRRRPVPFPACCSRQEVEVTFNYAEVEPVGSSKRVCSSYLTVDDEGTVTMNGVSYDVPWGAEGPLARGRYTMSVHSAPVFDVQPTSSDVHNRLSITSVAPVSHCSVGDVDEAFSDGESYTVFEVDGCFDRKQSQAKLAGVKPVFMKYAVDKTHDRRQVLLEVEALLDHLFRHKNTPVHVAKRRFLVFRPPTSNLWWMSSEVERTTAKLILADHGATAILLHPEARSSDVNAKYSGKLREPIIKVIHLVRAMEYRDAHDEPIVFRQLQNVFGQFPFLAPSVFNFYVSKFELLGV